MDISDEIEVASILERDATIALPFQSLLTTLVFQWRQKNCAASSELLFCLFSRCCRFSGCVEIGSNVTMLNILDMRWFCLKNQFCRSYITNTYCNIVCFVLRPSFMSVMFFWSTLYGVKEVVHWFLLPLATTRFTMVNLIVIWLLLSMVLLWLHNCHTKGFRS